MPSCIRHREQRQTHQTPRRLAAEPSSHSARHRVANMTDKRPTGVWAEKAVDFQPTRRISEAQNAKASYLPQSPRFKCYCTYPQEELSLAGRPRESGAQHIPPKMLPIVPILLATRLPKPEHERSLNLLIQIHTPQLSCLHDRAYDQPRTCAQGQATPVAGVSTQAYQFGRPAFQDVTDSSPQSGRQDQAQAGGDHGPATVANVPAWFGW